MGRACARFKNIPFDLSMVEFNIRLALCQSSHIPDCRGPDAEAPRCWWYSPQEPYDATQITPNSAQDSTIISTFSGPSSRRVCTTRSTSSRSTTGLRRSSPRASCSRTRSPSRTSTAWAASAATTSSPAGPKTALPDASELPSLFGLENAVFDSSISHCALRGVLLTRPSVSGVSRCLQQWCSGACVVALVFHARTEVR